MSLDDLLGVIDDRDRSWMPDAACKGMDPELFHARRGEDVAQIKAICWGKRGHAPCPVREQCAAYGMREHFGVWGGLSERERRAKRRNMPKPPRPIKHGTNAGYVAHYRKDETPCPACRDAHNVYQNQRKSRTLRLLDGAA